jgi:hypothetical protein
VLGGDAVAPVRVCNLGLFDAGDCEIRVGPGCCAVAVEFGPVALRRLLDVCVVS